MTHHLFVLKTEIQMYLADNVMYSHGGAETQVARYSRSLGCNKPRACPLYPKPPGGFLSGLINGTYAPPSLLLVNTKLNGPCYNLVATLCIFFTKTNGS